MDFAGRGSSRGPGALGAGDDCGGPADAGKGFATKSVMTTTQAAAELERVEQHITLMLQRIDGNFAACHEAACGLLAAAVKQLDASGRMWAAVQPWARFFEDINAPNRSRATQEKEIVNGKDDGDDTDDLLRSPLPRNSIGTTKSSKNGENGITNSGVLESRSPTGKAIKLPAGFKAGWQQRPFAGNFDLDSDVESSPPIPQLRTLDLREVFDRKGGRKQSEIGTGRRKENCGPPTQPEAGQFQSALPRESSKDGEVPSASSRHGRLTQQSGACRTSTSTLLSTATPPSIMVGVRFASNDASPASPTFSPPVTLPFGGIRKESTGPRLVPKADRRVSFSTRRGLTPAPARSPPLTTPKTRGGRRMSISKRGAAATPCNSARRRAKELLAYVADSPVPPLRPDSATLRMMVSSARRGGRLRYVSAGPSGSPSPFTVSTEVDLEEKMRAHKELKDDIDVIFNAVNSDALNLRAQIAEAREFGVSDSEGEEQIVAQKGGGELLSSPPLPQLSFISADTESPPVPTLTGAYTEPPAVQPPPTVEDLSEWFKGVQLDEEEEIDTGAGDAAVEEPTADLLGPRQRPAFAGSFTFEGVQLDEEEEIDIDAGNASVEEPTVDLLGPRQGPASAGSFTIRTNPYERQLQQIKRMASSCALRDESPALLRLKHGGSPFATGLEADEDVTIGMGRSSGLPIPARRAPR